MMYVFFRGDTIVHVVFLDSRPTTEEAARLEKLFDADRVQACMTWDICEDAETLFNNYTEAGWEEE
jgi:hypothetical protein